MTECSIGARPATEFPETREETRAARSRGLPAVAGQYVRVLLTVLAVYVVLHFVLIPGNRLIGFPVHHDDFNNLAYTRMSLPKPIVRPLSTLALVLLSYAGIPAYYLALHVLTVAYLFLALIVVLELFELRAPPLASIASAAVAVLSFEQLAQYYKYTGLITNLVSSNFGALALLVLIAAFRRGRDARWLLVGTLLAVCSLLAKEDFILAILAVLAAAALGCEGRSMRKWGLRALVLLAGTALAWMAYNVFVVRSAFVASRTGTYRSELSPVSLVATTFRYLSLTRVTSALALVSVLALLLAFSRRYRGRLPRLLLLQLVVLCLIAPYASLPDHVYAYYSLNWLPFQAGVLLVLVPQAAGRRTAMTIHAAVLVLCVALAAWTHPSRRSHVDWYVQRAQVNENIVGTLLRYRTRIMTYPEVAVTGVGGFNPWFATDGSFLANRYGLRCRWVVFVPRQSSYLEATRRLLSGTRKGLVETAELEEVRRRRSLPVLELQPDGTGAFLPPGSRPGPAGDHEAPGG